MSRAEKVLLYGESFWISPYVFSTYVALMEKRLPFEMRILSLNDREHLRSDFRDRSVTASVPTIEHNGFWLAESLAIAEFLEEEFPAPTHPRLFPEGKHERARARQLMSWIRSDLMPLRQERPTTTMFYERATQPLSPAGRDSADKLLRVAESVIPTDAGPLFGNWALVDADLAFMLHRLLLNGHDVPQRVRAYAEAQWQRPSVRGYVAHERPAKYTPSR